LSAERNVVIAKIIDTNLCDYLLGSGFRTRGRQIDLYVIGRRHCACHHEEQQEQEDEVGHRRHRKRSFNPISSFQSHNFS
jgi:hypothetical protein